ncbi:MAG: hypothetical protein ACR2OC_08100 [Solirubrobacterales bacterium]
MSRAASRRLRAGALLASGLLALSAGIGCGGDEETTTPSTTPTIEPATPTGATGAAGVEGTEDVAQSEDGNVDPDDGTVTPPAESGTQTIKPEDSPENDTPPEPGSAAEQFEQYCDENPDACG